jgi:hypothetical protein
MRLLFVAADGVGVDWLESQIVPAVGGEGGWETVVHGELRAPIPMTGPSWTSILTGLTVAQHGVVDGWGRKVGVSRGFADLEGEYIWDRPLGTCGIVGIPTVWPPRRPNAAGGWMVAGYPFAPGTWPRGLLDGIDYVSDYASAVHLMQRARGESEWWPDEHTPEAALALMALSDELRIAALEKLPPVEHLFVGVMLFDRVGHKTFDLPNAASYLEEAARLIAGMTVRLRDRFAPDWLAIASDHGWTLDRPGHDPRGGYALFRKGKRGAVGRVDLVNHELRATLESYLVADDSELLARLQALGYA